MVSILVGQRDKMRTSTLNFFEFLSIVSEKVANWFGNLQTV